MDDVLDIPCGVFSKEDIKGRENHKGFLCKVDFTESREKNLECRFGRLCSSQVYFHQRNLLQSRKAV